MGQPDSLTISLIDRPLGCASFSPDYGRSSLYSLLQVGTMELSIADCHNRCDNSFKELIDALQAPERDFGEKLTLASIREDYGRFKVWRGNTGAHQNPSRRISLDYRLRDSKFYRDKIIRHLLDLTDALNQSAQLVRGERLPVEECSSPTESSVASEAETDEEEDEDLSDDNEPSTYKRYIPSAMLMSEEFATLRNLIGEPIVQDRKEPETFLGSDIAKTISTTSDTPDPEVVQLRIAITDILSHLYKLSMFIRRRPVPQDRLTRSAKINVKHFEQFDLGYVQDCFPSAQEWLQKRLAKAITRRRQHLLYNKRHHEHLARPRPPLRTSSGLTDPEKRPGIFSAPVTVVHNDNKHIPAAPSIAKLTAAPNYDDNTEAIDWEGGTQSSYASTLGGKDIIYIPPRPKDVDGLEMTEFECPYCFRIQEIHSSRAWRKHVLTDLTPYVCTFEQCVKVEAMFESRSAWYAHELQFHRREWLCGEPSHKVYRNQSDFRAHLQKVHQSEFSEAQLPTFIKSCERALQAETIECSLCTEDTPVVGDDGEPTIRREPKFVSARIFQRHLGRHMERLALFAISSTEEEVEGDRSLPSENLNSGASQLSWIDEDLSSSSAEGSGTDRTTDYMEKLANPPSKPAKPESSSATASTSDDLPPELQPATEPNNNIQLPCRVVHPHERNPNYVGREETFAKIQKALDPNGSEPLRTYRQIFALCGSGGLGKTQTALNYVFEEMENFQVVLWAHASSQLQLIESFSRFAVELGVVPEKVGKEEDPTIDADILKAWFNEAEVPWLLVVDAADNLDSMDDYLPTGRFGSILITSRNASLVPKYGGMILGTLNEGNAIQLLVGSMKMQGWTEDEGARTVSAATAIVRRLGCFPLAVMEAARYIASNREKRLSDFLAEYERNELAHTISSTSLIETRPFNLSVLWKMSYSELTPDQQKLLNTMSFFDPTGIPLDLISQGAVKARGAGSESLDFVKSSQRFRRCKSALTKSSLVMQNENIGQLWMHQLYQESAQARMSVEERQQSWDRAVALLDGMWPVADRNKRRRPDLWPEQTKYLPHIRSLAHWYWTYSGTAHSLRVDDRFAELLCQAAFFCLVRGFFDPVDELLDLVQAYCSLCTSDCELLLFKCYWARGGTQLQLNRFEEGQSSFTQGYDTLQRAVEKGLITADDDRIAIASGLMGNGCMGVNKFTEAEEWYLKGFQRWDTMDDDAFRDKQLFVSNIAVCLTFQGRCNEAEELLLHSLNGEKKLSGFKLADTLYTLGNVRIGQKDLVKAFEHFKEAYTILMDELGERHRLTANCCYRLAWLLNQQRKYKSAISMFEQALAAYEENPYYRNECTRTKYMLGTVNLEHGDEEKGQEYLDTAREMLKEIRPDADVMGWTENDYDLLVMPWSR